MPGPKVGKTWSCSPGDWEQEKHYYPRALNAQLHPLVASFLALDTRRIATRYCHLHPEADKEYLLKALAYKAKYFRWSGADLFCVTNGMAQRQMIIIESNSCPSGQKSMPCSSNENESSKGTMYYKMISSTFGPMILDETLDLPEGVLCAIFDKNPMEATGYAQCIADFCNRKVFLVESFKDDANRPARWTSDGVLEVRIDKEEALKELEGKDAAVKPVFLEDGVSVSDSQVWAPVRGAFRYVTQAPWSRIPVQAKTLILNPIISCISGGRNKLVASKAYDFLNAEIEEHGLEIRTPDTTTDVTLQEVPLYVKAMGYVAVVKVPYSNAGQGVFTITNEEELDSFMEWATANPKYDQFIIQALVGNSTWSSKSKSGTFYHVGTVPSLKCKTYVADLRMMVCATAEGFRPLAIYARRAREALTETLTSGSDSWEQLGTNLSVVNDDGSWGSETARLLLMDRKDFNKLGLGIDDLVDGFIQTVLAATAIDRMAKRLLHDGVFEEELFASLNKDTGFLDEIMRLGGEKKEEQKDKSA